jgi:hypothetical protein
MKSPVILFRKGLDEEDEFRYASRAWTFPIYEYRSQIPSNSLVIGRYSCLPFYKELSEELELNGSKLVNSYAEHRYIADIRNWYEDIKEYTPKTWFTWAHLNEGQFVVKGLTNSRKFQWNTHMFADGRENLLKVIRRLFDDQLIGQQGLCVREYVPLKTYAVGINGMRFTNEWRCFFLGENLVSLGYYWSNYDGEDRPKEINQKGYDLLDSVAPIISKRTNFFVVDIAETENGDWIVIEINDGQMSGLSTIDKEEFYSCLAKQVTTYQP